MWISRHRRHTPANAFTMSTRFGEKLGGSRWTLQPQSVAFWAGIFDCPEEASDICGSFGGIFYDQGILPPSHRKPGQEKRMFLSAAENGHETLSCD